MNRKIGKFKLWQLLAIGGALGLVIYEYEKSRKTKEGTTPEGFAASTANPLGGGGGGEGNGLAGNSAPVAIPGEPGPPGPPGTPGPVAPELSTLSPGQLAEVEGKIAAANLPLAKAILKPAPVGTRFPQINPLTGQHYRTAKEHGKTVHIYQNGHRVVVGRRRAPVRHPNPQHKPSHAAPRAAIHHGRPARPKPHTVEHRAAVRPRPVKPHSTPRKRRGR